MVCHGSGYVSHVLFMITLCDLGLWVSFCKLSSLGFTWVNKKLWSSFLAWCQGLIRSHSPQYLLKVKCLVLSQKEMAPREIGWMQENVGVEHGGPV